jgi:hypothetical protein
MATRVADTQRWYLRVAYLIDLCDYGEDEQWIEHGRSHSISMHV